MASYFPLQIACILLGALLPISRRNTTVRDSRVNRKPVWQNEPRNTNDFNGGLFGWPRLFSGKASLENGGGQNGRTNPSQKIQYFQYRRSGRPAWAKMAEHPNWDNSNDFNTPRHRRVTPLAAAARDR